MKRHSADSTNRSLAAFEKLQHIRLKGSCTRCSGSCASTSPFPTIRRAPGAVSI